MSSSARKSKFEIFGEFMLLKPLVSDTFAETFLARSTKPGAHARLFVVTRIRRKIARASDFDGDFRAAIGPALALNHPHVVRIHDSGRVDERPFLVTEYLEERSIGEIAARFAKKGEPIPIPTALGLVAQAASGLHHAHAFENLVTGETVNAIHRNISPRCLVVDYGGNLRVADFGIAKMREKAETAEDPDDRHYRSPERTGGLGVDGRSDLFSLGVVLWELLAGRAGVADGEAELPAPSELNPEVPPELDALVRKVLAREPDRRHPTPASFQAEIRAVLATRYPDYAYGDTAQIMHALFEEDVALERTDLRDRNDAAQRKLNALWKEEIRDEAGARVRKAPISRRFALVAFSFGLAAAAAIRLDARESLFDRFFRPTPAETLSASEAVKAKRLAATTALLPPPLFVPPLERPVPPLVKRAPAPTRKPVAKARASRPARKAKVAVRPVKHSPSRLISSVRSKTKAPKIAAPKRKSVGARRE